MVRVEDRLGNMSKNRHGGGEGEVEPGSYHIMGCHEQLIKGVPTICNAACTLVLPCSFVLSDSGLGHLMAEPTNCSIPTDAFVCTCPTKSLLGWYSRFA